MRGAVTALSFSVFFAFQSPPKRDYFKEMTTCYETMNLSAAPRSRAVYENKVLIRGLCRLCTGPYNVQPGKTPLAPKVYSTGWCPRCIAEVDAHGARKGVRPPGGYGQQCFIYQCIVCMHHKVDKCMPPLGANALCNTCRDEKLLAVDLTKDD